MYWEIFNLPQKELIFFPPSAAKYNHSYRQQAREKGMSFFDWTSLLAKHWTNIWDSFPDHWYAIFSLKLPSEQFYFRPCIDPLLQSTLLHLSEQCMYHLHTSVCVNLWFNELSESPTAELEKWGRVFVID